MVVPKAYTEELVESYDRRRFGGRSGQLILQRDTEAVESLLEPSPGLVLDIPCGTGVYVAALREKGYDVVAADASVPMLEVTGRRQSDAFRVLCDINHLPFRDGAFDAVTTIRLFSHYSKDQMTPILLELRRIIGPRGRLVFDTFRWTPRRWPLFRRFLEESYIYVLPHHEVEAAISKAGLKRVASRSLYLFSPIWQRKLPFWILWGLAALESVLPQRWLLRTFWACTKD